MKPSSCNIEAASQINAVKDAQQIEILSGGVTTSMISRRRRGGNDGEGAIGNCLCLQTSDTNLETLTPAETKKLPSPRIFRRFQPQKNFHLKI